MHFARPAGHTKIRGPTHVRIAPRLVVGKQSGKQLSCMRMTRANATESPDDRAASEIEITEGVEQFMANELVRIAQTVSVQYAVATNYHDIIELSAAPETRRPQTVHFVEKAKGSCSAKLRFERRGIEHDAHVLLANQGVGETDFEAHGKAVIGQ